MDHCNTHSSHWQWGLIATTACFVMIYFYGSLCRRKTRKNSNADSSVDGSQITFPIWNGVRFENPWPTWRGLPNWIPYLKYCLFQTPPNPPASQAELDRVLPVMKPDSATLMEIPSPADSIRFTWLGHATCLIQINGLNILTDPVFSDRCFAVQFVGPKRYRPPPLSIEELPPIDVVLISHDHYDHLDLNSVVLLNGRFASSSRGRLRWCVPTGLSEWMVSVGVSRANVLEFNWWDEKALGLDGDATTTKFVFTPTQHWCSRSLWDRNRVLWGSWAIIGDSTKCWFGGDTAYCGAFKEIGDELGPFDLAVIPIGAYEPCVICANQHVNPDEAVLIHRDVASAFSIGCHWGTFVLSSEHFLAPPRDLAIAREKYGIDENTFVVVNHGESKLITKKY